MRGLDGGLEDYLEWGLERGVRAGFGEGIVWIRGRGCAGGEAIGKDL